MSALYELSKRVRELVKTEPLLSLHIVRYSFFVESSTRGEECVYAHHTKRYLLSELDQEITLMEDRRRVLDESIKELKAWAEKESQTSELEL